MIEPIALLMGMQTGRLIAGQRVITAAQALWETLFEGEVVAENNTGENGYFDVVTFDPTPLFTKNEGIRVTINGVSHIATAVWFNGGASVGNVWLYQKTEETENEDNGLDYFIYTNKAFLVPANFIYTREPGTYQVKIERALFDPVAYLYNGVRLPQLPEYDKEKYPYAGIFDFSTDNYRLRLLQADAYYTQNGLRYVFKSDNPCLTLRRNSDGEWLGSFDTDDYGGWITVGDKTVWTNFDLLNADGTVYLAASEPIPVYE